VIAPVSINPRMLTFARESRRMTQKALAEASNTWQSSVSRAEAGLDRPSQAVVDAWAAVLRYESALFEQQDLTLLPRTPLFRKRAALKKVDIDATAAVLHIRCRQVDVMAQAVEIPDETVPKVNLDVEGWTAAQAAQWVRAKWRLSPGPIENVARLIEDHGIVVARLPGVGDAFMGISIFAAGQIPLILVSSEAPGCRDRWTLAHELGHLVLHHHRDNDALEHCEEEADEFAAEFLMPAHEIRPQFGQRLGLAELGQLKRHWRTSMQALISRARQVRRISDSQEERLWRLISARGYRRQEPIDVGVDQIEIIDEMVRVHLEDLGFSMPELAKALWLKQEEFQQVFLRSHHIGPAQSQDAPSESKPRLRLVD
jgi:Zn-dependent peptidase ImmA (M78 family)/transcriptional regulator with XRE-family HTH domain